MDIFTALHSRRSVRNYTDKPVSESDIHTLLDAAMIAPSAGNAQPWQFVVIRDAALLKKVSTAHPYVGMAAKAPLAIAVCAELALEKYPGYWVQDCSAAMQNLLLAATGLGLGTVWTGIYPVEDRVATFCSLLRLPEGVVPLGLAVIGHPASPAESKSRFNADRVHYEQFGKQSASL